jgi:hypothetical protein
MRSPLVATLALLTAGCYVVGVNEAARPGYAYVTVPTLPDQTVAVGLIAAKSRHAIIEQAVTSGHRESTASFSLRPGTHLLEIDCYRPNATSVLHGGFDFVVSVKAGTTYVLDCAPAKAAGYEYYENHFSLKSQ